MQTNKQKKKNQQQQQQNYELFTLFFVSPRFLLFFGFFLSVCLFVVVVFVCLFVCLFVLFSFLFYFVCLFFDRFYIYIIPILTKTVIKIFHSFNIGFLAMAPKIMCADEIERVFITITNFTRPVEVMIRILEGPGPNDILAETPVKLVGTPCACMEIRVSVSVKQLKVYMDKKNRSGVLATKCVK